MSNHKSKPPRTQRAQTEVSTPKLEMRFGDEPKQQFDPGAFDPSLWAELAQKAIDAAGALRIGIHELPHWPDLPRWALFEFIRGLPCPPEIRIDGKRYRDTFEGVVATMAGPADMAAHARSIKAAVEVAALFYGDEPQAAAGRIDARLRELGATKLGVRELTRRIRGLSGGGDNGSGGAGGGLDAHAAAQAYVGWLREQAGIDDAETPVLLYFRSEFYSWDGRRWARQHADVFAAAVTRHLQEMGTPKLGGRYIADVIANLRAIALLDCWNEDLPFYIDSTQPVQISHPRRIVLNNGAIDLDELTAKQRTALRPHDPRWFNETLLPYDHRGKVPAAEWREFLNQVLPKTNEHDQRQRVLQEFFGYCLLHSCRFEKMLILVGEGANGKSVTLDVLSAMLGPRNVEHVPFDQLGSEFRLAALQGKSANITMELNHLGRANEALLRNLISGEPINVNRKFLTPLPMRLITKLVIGCNELPNITDTTQGVWRRFIIMPFDVTIPEDQMNRQLAVELTANMTGIFNWALSGLMRLLRENRFTACTRCDAMLSDFRRDSNSVAEFLAECATANPAWECHSQRLFEVYRYFCEMRARKPVAGNEVGKRLKRLGYRNGRGCVTPDGSRPHVYLGLRLTPAGQEWVHRYRNQRDPGWSEVDWLSDPSGCPS